MPSWGKNDNAANTPLWAATSVKLAPTRANAANLFGNTTANAFIANETVGLFGLDANEIATNKNTGAHTGWVLRTEGSGGRAGRVQQEVLVALSSMTGDAEDVVYKDTIITVGTNPSAVTTTAGNTATFGVVATSTPSATLSYQWQQSATLGGTYVDVVDGTPANTTYVGGTTNSLVVTPADTTANNNYYRVVVTASDTGATATSTPAKLTVV